jgi:glycolate oxidase FAD binding subunit
VVVTTAATEKPLTAEELARILHEASQAGTAVTPVGGGRAMGMGDPPDRHGIELHTTRLNRVLEHSQPDMVVSVEAGITLEALQAELAKAGQFLPIDPFNSPGHTIGGLLATGWAGPLRLRFGSARDFLIGIRVALPDGKLASGGGRVVKNVSGYDMMKLHYGALGTLGVIVAASFRVFPKPMHDVTVDSSYQSVEEAWDAAARLLSMPLPPAALELFSDGRAVARFLGSPDAVTRMVADSGWKTADPSIWAEHSKRAAQIWARIAVPRSQLQSVLKELPPGERWWASPGVGIANWSIDSGFSNVQGMRERVEALGGTLVMLAAPDEVMSKVGAWGRRPETLGIMQRIKDVFDPNRILNPGRFVV